MGVHEAVQIVRCTPHNAARKPREFLLVIHPGRVHIVALAFLSAELSGGKTHLPRTYPKRTKADPRFDSPTLTMEDEKVINTQRSDRSRSSSEI